MCFQICQIFLLWVYVCAMVHLVKCPCWDRVDISLIPAGNGWFFSVCVTKLLSMVLGASIFLKNYQNIGLWTIGTKIFSTIRLLEYRISDQQDRETFGLSDIRFQTQTIGYRIKKNYRLPSSDFSEEYTAELWMQSVFQSL